MVCIFRMMLGGKVAIVTGAAQGLGKAFSKTLVQRVVKVCIADVNTNVGQKTANQFCSEYGKESAFFMECDVRNESHFEAVFKETLKKYNNIDILCNNAGIMHEGKWNEMIDINLNGVIRGVMLGIKYMGVDRGGSGGLIVNVASMAGFFPMVFGPIYTASKHGVLGLTKAWANEPGYRKHKVKIAALCPAIADTDIIKIKPDQVTNLPMTEKVFQLLGVLPPEQVAEAFLQLVEDEESNGKILTITTHNGIKEHEYVIGKSMQ